MHTWLCGEPAFLIPRTFELLLALKIGMHRPLRTEPSQQLTEILDNTVSGRFDLHGDAHRDVAGQAPVVTHAISSVDALLLGIL